MLNECVIKRKSLSWLTGGVLCRALVSGVFFGGFLVFGVMGQAVRPVLTLPERGGDTGSGGGSGVAGFTPRAVMADYKITAFDSLSILVVDEPLLTIVTRVSASGTITYPFLGNLDVGGKSVSFIESMIRDALEKDYLVNPQVVVNIHEFRRQTVSVMGEVNRPGIVELRPDQKMDVLEAIVQAGGLNRLASPKKIEVTRDGVTTRFKMDDLQRITDSRDKFWLKPNDLIYVQQAIF